MATGERAVDTAHRASVAPFELVRELAAAGLAAVVAGLLVGGVGGRLAMRLSGSLNPDLAGRLTEAGERIGDITASGTMELILFGGLLTGIVAAIPWVAIRPWLPAAPWRRSLVAAAAAVAILGGIAVEADNFDFSMLRPRWLHVAMFTALVGAAGWVTASLDTRFVRRLRHSRGFTVLAIPMVGLGVALPVLAVAAEGGAPDGIPVVVAALVGLTLVATAIHTTFRQAGRVIPSWLDRAGRLTAVAAVITGLTLFTQSVFIIL